MCRLIMDGAACMGRGLGSQLGEGIPHSIGLGARDRQGGKVHGKSPLSYLALSSECHKVRGE